METVLTKSIIIFGGHGLIGSALSKDIQEHHVVKTSSKAKIVSHSDRFFDIRSVNPNLFLRELRQSFPENNFVAAILAMMPFSVDDCYNLREQARDANVHKTKNLINTLVLHGIKPIYLSTDYVFDGQKGLYMEDDVSNPLTEYGKQKFEIETFMRSELDDCLILRLGKVMCTKEIGNSLFQNMVSDILRQKEVDLATDQIMGPVLIDDIVLLINKLLARRISGLFHVSNGETVSRYALYETIIEKMRNIHPHVQFMANPVSLANIHSAERRPKNTSLDNSLIQQKVVDLAFTTISEMCARRFGNNK